MENNILGGLVIFVVVITCLLLLDDISTPKETVPHYEGTELQHVENDADLAVVQFQH
ncbi:hypothetical protein DFQ08_101103 [Winogradskyella arenosi]|uniref:Uncharacterized protein n=1 Tax=Winogradskyella arenosi TaxID=533325 RepID=A0A368ZHT8_9FLAO|nr:hypothetical protein DFQ08_101103 [Winogradskyella arenosi]